MKNIKDQIIEECIELMDEQRLVTLNRNSIKYDYISQNKKQRGYKLNG